MGPRFRGDDTLAVIAGLDPAIHPSSQKLFAKKMDARVISAFARVFDALLPAHDELAATSVDIALFGALAGPIPVFSCFSADSESSIPGLTISSTHTSSFPRRVFCARGLHLCFAHPEPRGGRSAESRSGAAAPVGRAITPHARRLRGALRPMLMTRDARLSALHRGGFGLPGPRFRLLGRPPYGQVPCGSVQRAPRTQVVVPGGRGPCLPGRAVTSRRRRTPRLAPYSGSSLEHALNERG